MNKLWRNWLFPALCIVGWVVGSLIWAVGNWWKKLFQTPAYYQPRTIEHCDLEHRDVSEIKWEAVKK